MAGSYVVTPEESKFVDVEEGKYRALIEDIEVQELQYGPSFKWKFKLLDEPYVDIPLSALTSTTVTPKSKIWPWLVALGYEPQIDEPFDIMAFVGYECWIMVDRKADPKDATKVYSNVTKIVPAPRALAAPAAAPAPQRAPAPAVRQAPPPQRAPAPAVRQAPPPQRAPAPAARPGMARPGAPGAVRPAAPRPLPPAQQMEEEGAPAPPAPEGDDPF